MKNIDDFLDAVKTRTGSDYKTGKLIGIAGAHIGNWRGRRSMPSNKHIILLCDYAGISIEEAIRAIEYSREFEREIKEAGFASLEVTTALAGMSLLAVHPTPEAAIGAGLMALSALSIHYANLEGIEIGATGEIKSQLFFGFIHEFQHLQASNSVIAA